jgi:hypothetical protein
MCRFLETISKQDGGDPPLVVYVTHRRSITKKAVATLPKLNDRPWISYDDITGPIDIQEHNLIVIQYESMSRLTGYGQEEFRNIIVVLDEFNSTLHQMHGTAGNPIMAQFTFCKLSRMSTYVIAMDANLDQERLDILERYTGRRAYLIQNTFKSRAHQVFRITRERHNAMRFIFEALQRDERVISPCFSKEMGEKLFKFVKANFGDTKTVLMYNSDHRWDGEDINVAWIKADVCVHTSTIDSGLSFEVCGHFQHCVCFFDHSGPTYESAIQMLGRSRDTDEYLICINT